MSVKASVEEEIYSAVLDHLIRRISVELHRRICTSGHWLEYPRVVSETVVDVPGLDVFGNKPEKGALEFATCSNCGRSVNVLRFAPHMEKCMGMGRSAARRQRRVNTRGGGDESRTGKLCDRYANGSNGKRPRENGDANERNESPPRKRPATDTKGEDYQLKKLRTFFETHCGAPLLTSGNYCSKSLKCHIHSHEQRVEARKAVGCVTIDYGHESTPPTPAPPKTKRKKGRPRKVIEVESVDGDVDSVSSVSTPPTLVEGDVN